MVSLFMPAILSAAATGAHTIYGDNTTSCGASLALLNPGDTQAKTVLGTGVGDPASELYNLTQGISGESAGAIATFKDVYNKQGVLNLGFADAGGGANNYVACNNSITFFRKVVTSDQNTFYGVWRCVPPGATGSTLCPSGGGLTYKLVTATINPSAKTMTFSWPGGNNGATTTATINVADPDGDFANSQYFSNGASGGTSQTVATCLSVNQHNDISQCLKGKTARFVDTAHISFDNVSYVASSWGGNDIYYTAENDPTLTNLGAKFDVKTNHTDTDLNIDDPSKISDLADLRKTLGGGYRASVEYDIIGNSGTVPVDAGTGNTSINQVANYYSNSSDPSSDSIQLVFTNGAGTNEGRFYGVYSRSDATSTTFTYANGGYSCGSSEKPRFVLSHNPTAGEEDGSHTLTATWYIQTNNAPCGEEAIPVTILLEPVDAIPPALNGTCAAGTDANGNCTGDTDVAIDCGTGTLNWIVCRVIEAALGTVEKLDNFIMNTLDIDVKPIFDNVDSNTYYTAWNSFRVIAIALLIVAGLIMVASQALGFEFLDAYTIRKTLPRLIVAIIGISLSWPLMRYCVNLFDALGFDVRALIYHPFKGLNSHFSISVGLWSMVGTFAAVWLLGWASLTFALSIALAMFIGFVTLVARQVVIIVLVILAPIGIACYILPNTQRAWRMWHENFLGMLLLFPIISALMAACDVFTAVALSHGGTSTAMLMGQVGGLLTHFSAHRFHLVLHSFANNTGGLVASGTAIGFQIVKPGLIPIAWNFTTGALRNVAGKMGGMVKGMQDGLRNIRGNALRKSFHDMAHGQKMKGNGKIAKGFNNLTETIASIPSADLRLTKPNRWRSEVKAAKSRRTLTAAAEAAEKNEALRSFIGNDDVLQAALHSKGDDKKAAAYLRNLRDDKGNQIYDNATIGQHVADIQAARRSMNNEVFEAAAAMALPATGTAFARRARKNERGDLLSREGQVVATRNAETNKYHAVDGSNRELTDDEVKQVSFMIGGAGEMHDFINEVAGSDRSMAARMLVSMRQGAAQARRFDLAGGGFGAQMKVVQDQYTGTITAEQGTKTIVRQSLEGQGGGYVAGARKGAVEFFAPEMVDKLMDVVVQGQPQNMGDPAAVAQWERLVDQELASIEGRYAAAAGVAPENQRVIAEQLDRVVTIGGVTQKLGEHIAGRRRSSPAFQQMVKQFQDIQERGAQQLDANEAHVAAYQQALRAQQAQAGGGPIPPVLPPPPGMGGPMDPLF
ncbi:MAG TPA: hypothetical protein VLF69_05905 [Candidatus Saccharimonadales bacterium]|nr:hypothetical protein [Candidatus Saccharimonadales bacterium]